MVPLKRQIYTIYQKPYKTYKTCNVYLSPALQILTAEHYVRFKMWNMTSRRSAPAPTSWTVSFYLNWTQRSIVFSSWSEAINGSIFCLLLLDCRENDFMKKTVLWWWMSRLGYHVCVLKLELNIRMAVYIESNLCSSSCLMSPLCRSKCFLCSILRVESDDSTCFLIVTKMKG